MLLRDGWAGTTIRAIAREAEVSPETIYKGFGSKAALLKSVYDVRIAGDDAPIPIAEREGIVRLRAAATPDEAADAWAAHALTINARSAPLIALALRAQAGEPALADFVRATDAERMTGADRTAAHWEGLGWLRVPHPQARDRIWLLGSPASYLDLLDLGWGEPQIHEWYRSFLVGLVLRVAPAARSLHS